MLNTGGALVLPLYVGIFLHYILSVSFGSVLSAIGQLLPQIIVRKTMRTALFSVACALPVFIILHYIYASSLFLNTSAVPSTIPLPSDRSLSKCNS